MSMYSLNGEFPQELPSSWKQDENTTRTDLNDLTDSQLEALGWYGPITMPPLTNTSYYTHRYEWNSGTKTFSSVELDEFEKEQSVNYVKFWDEINSGNSTWWAKVKSTARTSLPANTEMTEFISIMTNVKNVGVFQKRQVQTAINDVFSEITFTDAERADFTEIFNSSGLNAVYTIPSA